MDKYIKSIYISEIIAQANRATHCAHQLHQLLQQDSSEDFFREVEHFIQHAAAISQLLWPSNKKGRKRAEYLRTYLKIEQDNILHNRDLRNRLVHFDERLDNWVDKSKRHNFVDQSIGDVHKLIKGVEAIDYIRNFNPATMEYIFLNEKFNLRDIQVAIEQIKRLLSNSI
jgi:thiamine kinase-like enzyme